MTGLALILLLLFPLAAPAQQEAPAADPPAEPTESAHAAAQRMLQRKVGSLVIVDPEKHPIGILTDRDLTVRVVAKNLLATTTPVAEVMTPDPQVTEEDAGVDDVLGRMRAGGFRRMPVVDGDGTVVGVVSMDDVLQRIASETRMIAELLDRLKKLTYDAGLKGRVRINKAGCLGRCGTGASIVVYPEAVWYGRVKLEDIDEIFSEHVLGGRPVERLRS